MTSKIKVDNINKVSDDSNIIKKCGTTTTIGSGASNPIVVDGSAVTIGRCGGTVALASGASQTGFGRTGTVDWQTTIKTGNFSATNGEGYFVNTTSGSVTASLPAGTAGAIVAFKDYLNTFDTHALKVAPNGTDKIGGVNSTASFGTEAQSLTLIFVDSTRGWLDIHDSTTAAKGQTFVAATGGNSVVECGDHKIHVFTGPGTFCVSQISCSSPNNAVNYVVVAGGGGSANYGGGGAGGYRISADATPLTATVSPFPITVGGGGATGKNNGSTSTFSTISSAGGGGGGAFGSPGDPGNSGGSGGGGGGQITPSPGAGGAGNTPPVSPSQGNSGGAGSTNQTTFTNGGGGGGAGGAGSGSGGSDTSPRAGGIGRNAHTPEFGSWPKPWYSAGAGYPNPEYYAGGGAGESQNPSADASKKGGNGGGGPSSTSVPAPGTSRDGVTNTGGGGGAGGTSAGGSGIVLIRYKFQ